MTHKTAKVPAPSKPPKHRILLIEDHPIVRQGLTDLINQQEDLVICGGAESLSQALDQIPQCQPDLALLDIALKGTNGLEVLKYIRSKYPRLRVLVLSMYDEAAYAFRSIRSGAAG